MRHRLPGRGEPPAGRHSLGRPSAWREVGQLTLLYLAYTAARLVADPDPESAAANAHSLLSLEDDVRLDVERPANDLLTTLPGLALVSSYWYSLLHYVVTPVVLFWVFRSHSHRYRTARNLHVGWAVWCAAMVLLCASRPEVRVLAVAYPVVTAVVVVATANHYLLDVVAGVLVIATGALLARPARRPGGGKASPMEGTSCWPSLCETVPPESTDCA